MTSGAGSTTGIRRRGVRRREPAGKEPGGDGPAGGGHRGGREAEGFMRSQEGGGDWERRGGRRANIGRDSDVFDGRHCLWHQTDTQIENMMACRDGWMPRNAGFRLGPGAYCRAHRIHLPGPAPHVGASLDFPLNRTHPCVQLGTCLQTTSLFFWLRVRSPPACMGRAIRVRSCRPPLVGVGFWTRGQCCLT